MISVIHIPQLLYKKLQTIRSVENLSKNFPSGISYSIPYDTTRYVKASIHEVEKTILEAGAFGKKKIFHSLEGEPTDNGSGRSPVAASLT